MKEEIKKLMDKDDETKAMFAEAVAEAAKNRGLDNFSAWRGSYKNGPEGRSGEEAKRKKGIVDFIFDYIFEKVLEVKA